MNTSSGDGTNASRIRALELTAILLLAVVPDIGNSLLWLLPNDVLPYGSFLHMFIYIVLRSLQVALPVLLLMRVAGDPLSRFGIVKPRWVFDPLAGIVIFAVGWYSGVGAQELTKWWLERPLPDITVLKPPHGWEFALLPLFGALNGFAEELVMRGYLIPRFEGLLGQRADASVSRKVWTSGAAIMLSTALFAGYHVYHGWEWVSVFAVISIVYGAAFCCLRRLWPLVIAHMLADVFGYISIG